MRNEFETENLSNLIEITARNIKQIHKFSGLFDLPFNKFFKNIFLLKIQKVEVKKILLNIMI